MGNHPSFTVSAAKKDCDFLETEDGVKLSKNIIKQMELKMATTFNLQEKDDDCPSACNNSQIPSQVVQTVKKTVTETRISCN